MSLPLVHLHGPRTLPSAFSSINRRWWSALSARADLQLLDDNDDRVADVSIHHDFSTRFGDVLTGGRRRVAVRPWDFGPYPARWVEVLTRHYDELWVHSAWNERHALAAGVDRARVRRIPLGIDPEVMRPDGPRATLGLGHAFVFAFVGAAVMRKGIDLLLDAYRRAFRPDDPVALVIKDHTGDVFYQQQSYRDAILAAANDPEVPPILYLDSYMPVEDLASLLRRADAFVLPYRSEGFACPVLEAMACGTPPIVPDVGACVDYCDRTTGVLVPTREITLPVGRTLGMNSLGFEEHVDRVHFCETPVDRLAAAMREIAWMPRDDLAALGRAAADRARTWTWTASADAIAAAVRALG